MIQTKLTKEEAARRLAEVRLELDPDDIATGEFLEFLLGCAGAGSFAKREYGVNGRVAVARRGLYDAFSNQRTLDYEGKVIAIGVMGRLLDSLYM